MTPLQARKMRLAYFRSVLSQDIAWFDSNATGAIGNRLSEDIAKVSFLVDTLLQSRGFSSAVSAYICASALTIVLFILAWCHELHLRRSRRPSRTS